MKVKVISLREKNEKRRENIKQQMSRIEVDFSFFDAITPSENDTTSRELGIHFGESRMNDLEKSCMLSHLKIIADFANSDSGSDQIAIFEDDVHISDNLSIFIKNTSWIPVDAGIVKLEKFKKYYYDFLFTNKKYFKSHIIFPLKTINPGAAGYIITKNCAISLMNSIKNRADLVPVDHELFRLYLNSFGVTYQIEPALCIQDTVLNAKDSISYPSVVNSQKYTKNYKVKKTIAEKIKSSLKRISPSYLYKKIPINRKKSTMSK
ncbi:glycosyltransferase family 25 protein [Tatumella ptyseos]|uniref:glycosyltransferase family 25 protein n=1 Tax=Tatumella ptyseos TaxID=82987 RepID=UPI0026EFCAA9|nr:glycosyltransferase family 25 protein [Tatumella ptyseos]WKX26741.1 glycosyltransferase family 25 protein [Tatumella ptyseos]